MKISKAFRKAFQVYFGNRGTSAKFLLVELCLVLITLAPLLFLAESGLQLLALLSAVLFILILLPARMNAAGAMQDALRGGSLCSGQLLETRGYGKKLAFGLSRVLLLLLWGAPLIACLVIAKIHISGEMDGFTLLRMIKSFGNEDLLRGVVYLALILIGAILILAVGCGFHCGDRHALALGNPSLIKGRHGKMLGAWFCSLVALLPLLVAIVVLIVRYLPVLADLNGVVMGMVDLPSTRVSVMILAVGVVLTVPFVPLRSLIIAACAGGEGEEA